MDASWCMRRSKDLRYGAPDKESPLDRMFVDFGATPFSKTVPVMNSGVEVPQRPGLGADPEDDLIAQFRV